MKREIVEQETLLITPRFEVKKVVLRTKLSEEPYRDFFYIDKPDSVLVIVKLLDRIGLISVDRFLVNTTSYELIGGRIEKFENAIEAARRELLEETNLTGCNWRFHGDILSLPNISNEKTFIFSCDIENIDCLKLDVSEGIEKLTFFSKTEIVNLVKQYGIRSSADGYALLSYILSENYENLEFP